MPYFKGILKTQLLSPVNWQTMVHGPSCPSTDSMGGVIVGAYQNLPEPSCKSYEEALMPWYREFHRMDMHNRSRHCSLASIFWSVDWGKKNWPIPGTYWNLLKYDVAILGIVSGEIL